MCGISTQGQIVRALPGPRSCYVMISVLVGCQRVIKYSYTIERKLMLKFKLIYNKKIYFAPNSCMHSNIECDSYLLAGWLAGWLDGWLADWLAS